MAWAGQTWLQFYQETTYGTFNAAGALLSPRLYGGNSFTVRRVPARQVIRTADAGNRPIQVVANRQVFQGTLNTLLYPTQAAYWATMLTVVSNDIPSYSATYWDSIQAWKLLGGKAARWSMTSNAQQDYVSLSIDWIFQTRDTSFTVYAQPAQSVYPTEVPYVHVESQGNVLLGGSARTKYKSLNVNVANVLVGTWDEATTITNLYYCGRDFTFQIVPQYTATADRLAFEAQTPLTYILEWIRVAGSHNITFTLEASTYESGVADDLPLDGPGYQTIDNQTFFDKTATVDFAMTAV